MGVFFTLYSKEYQALPSFEKYFLDIFFPKFIKSADQLKKDPLSLLIFTRVGLNNIVGGDDVQQGKLQVLFERISTKVDKKQQLLRNIIDPQSNISDQVLNLNMGNPAFQFIRLVDPLTLGIGDVESELILLGLRGKLPTFSINEQSEVVFDSFEVDQSLWKELVEKEPRLPNLANQIETYRTKFELCRENLKLESTIFLRENEDIFEDIFSPKKRSSAFDQIGIGANPNNFQYTNPTLFWRKIVDLYQEKINNGKIITEKDIIETTASTIDEYDNNHEMFLSHQICNHELIKYIDYKINESQRDNKEEVIERWRKLKESIKKYIQAGEDLKTIQRRLEIVFGENEFINQFEIPTSLSFSAQLLEIVSKQFNIDFSNKNGWQFSIFLSLCFRDVADADILANGSYFARMMKVDPVYDHKATTKKLKELIDVLQDMGYVRILKNKIYVVADIKTIVRSLKELKESDSTEEKFIYESLFPPPYGSIELAMGRVENLF